MKERRQRGFVDKFKTIAILSKLAGWKGDMSAQNPYTGTNLVATEGSKFLMLAAVLRTKKGLDGNYDAEISEPKLCKATYDTLDLAENLASEPDPSEADRDKTYCLDEITREMQKCSGSQSSASSRPSTSQTTKPSTPPQNKPSAPPPTKPSTPPQNKQSTLTPPFDPYDDDDFDDLYGEDDPNGKSGSATDEEDMGMYDDDIDMGMYNDLGGGGSLNIKNNSRRKNSKNTRKRRKYRFVLNSTKKRKPKKRRRKSK